MVTASALAQPSVEWVVHEDGATITSRRLWPNSPELELSIEDRELLRGAVNKGALELDVLRRLGNLQRVDFGNFWVGCQLDGTIGIGTAYQHTTPVQLCFTPYEWIVFLVRM